MSKKSPGESPDEGLLSGIFASTGSWALVLGVTGFVCGFFGPMVFSPDANQGPMLGLFITGPGGAVLDDVTGPERVFAVFPDRAARFSEIAAAVTQALGEPSAAAVRRLEHLPVELPQQSVLLEKEPR